MARKVSRKESCDVATPTEKAPLEDRLRFRADGRSFLRALKIAGEVAGRATNALPAVRDHVLLETSEAGVFMHATDLETEISLALDGVVLGAGEALLPTKDAAKVTKRIAEPEFEHDAEKFESVISGSGKRFAFQPPDAGDFPSRDGLLGAGLPEGWEVVATSIASNLAFSAQRIAKAVGEKGRHARYALDCVLLDVASGARLVATDGQRLSVCEIEDVVRIALNERGILVPAGALATAAKCLEGEDGTVEILRSTTRFAIRSPRACVSCAVGQGEFPPWQDVLREDGDEVSFEVDPDVLLVALDDLSIYRYWEGSRGDRAERFFVVVGRCEGSITLSSSSPEKGAGSVEVEAPCSPGDAVELHAPYLRDALREAKISGEVRIGFAKEKPESKIVSVRSGPQEHWIMPVVR